VQVLEVLDTGAIGAEVKEPHETELQLKAAEVPWNGDPRYSPAVWGFDHGPLLSPSLLAIDPIRALRWRTAGL
jgi:hypothetical protein